MRKELVLLETLDGCTRWMPESFGGHTIKTTFMTPLTINSDGDYRQRSYQYHHSVKIGRREVRIYREVYDQG